MSSSSISKSQRIQIALLVVLIGVAVAIVVMLATRGSDDTSSRAGAGGAAAVSETVDSGAGPLEFLARRIDGDPMALGAVDAPVVMVEYSDYRCPFCGKFSRDTEPELIARYVDEGTLRLEWRDFPNFGPQSELAARAGRAAADQDRFWEFNALVYADTPDTGHRDLTEDMMVDYAERAGVPDLDRFRADMTSDRYDEAIAADVTEALSFGATGTPTFSVHGIPVVGAQPTSTFLQLIDEALGE